MQGFVQGADRQQTTLLPECIDDWIDESNSIRAQGRAIAYKVERRCFRAPT
jgi:hypothetical protein